MATNKLQQLIINLKQAIFIDKVRYLTEVSLTYNNYPYAVSGINRQDIKLAVTSINNEVGSRISYYINSYGVLCLQW